jgi:hypothetical protein
MVLHTRLRFRVCQRHGGEKEAIRRWSKRTMGDITTVSSCRDGFDQGSLFLSWHLSDTEGNRLGEFGQGLFSLGIGC